MTKALIAAAVSVVALLAAPTATAGPSIAVCNGTTAAPTCAPGPFTTTDGVWFLVSTGGGNRDFASVAVSCDNGYATTIVVDVPAKGTGYSQTIHPPAGTCTATLEKPMQIGKPHVLAGPVTFTVQS